MRVLHVSLLLPLLLSPCAAPPISFLFPLLPPVAARPSASPTVFLRSAMSARVRSTKLQLDTVLSQSNPLEIRRSRCSLFFALLCAPARHHRRAAPALLPACAEPRAYAPRALRLRSLPCGLPSPLSSTRSVASARSPATASPRLCRYKNPAAPLLPWLFPLPLGFLPRTGDAVAYTSLPPRRSGPPVKPRQIRPRHSAPPLFFFLPSSLIETSCTHDRRAAVPSDFGRNRRRQHRSLLGERLIDSSGLELARDTTTPPVPSLGTPIACTSPTT